jgi:predicted NBD/HSP70 family sugar kinase
VIVGVDIRPSQITVALADANGKFTSREVIATPTDPKTAVDELIESIRRILASAAARKWKAWASAFPAVSATYPTAWSSPRI